MFLIPVQSAVVERGFSLHRIVKNRLSNGMQIMTLDSLLRVKMLTHGPATDSFDYAAAAKAHSFVPLDLRSDKEDLKLRRLFKHVSKIELDLLSNGIDVGEESLDLNFSDDEDGEPLSYDFDAWSSDEEEDEMDEEANEIFGGVTAGGAGVEDGKMDKACMAEELDDL